MVELLFKLQLGFLGREDSGYIGVILLARLCASVFLRPWDKRDTPLPNKEQKKKEK